MKACGAKCKDTTEMFMVGKIKQGMRNTMITTNTRNMIQEPGRKTKQYNETKNRSKVRV